MVDKTDFLEDIANYYTGKLVQHGTTARGVDWNSEDGQALRFEQLCRVISADAQFSVNDLGCGYGSLLSYMQRRYPAFSYLGVDVSEEMVKAAAGHVPHDADARLIVGAAPDRVADYGIASGIFNVRLGHQPDAWSQHVQNTLDVLNDTSRRGFSFNCLTRYSDADRMRADLHYADPCALFDMCKRRYSRNVALLHDYGLYEFTIVVRK